MIEGRRVAANVLTGWAANVVKALIQLGMVPLMARLLGPAELGLYTLALPIIGFVMMLSDGGLGNSLAREKIDNHPVWSTAFWAMQLGGFFLAAVVIVTSFVVAAAAGQPRLPLVMIALSSTFLMVAASVIPAARMVRKGQLLIGPIGDMVGNVIGAGLGIYAAFRGLGVWSMVIQYVAAYGFRTLTLNIAERYRPRFIFNFDELKSHLMIGGIITGGKLSEVGGRILENIQISRVMGSSALGAFGFANQVSRSLCEAASNAIWANLYVMTLHSNEETVKENLLRLSRLLAMVIFPACGLVAASSTSLLPSILGRNWAGAGVPLMILTATMPFSVIGNMTGAIMYAKGQAQIPFWITLWQAVGRLGVVMLAPWIGLVGVCIGVGTVSVMQGFALIFATRRVIGHSPYVFMRHLMWPFLMSTLCATIFYSVATAGPGIELTLAALLGCAALYVLGLLALDGRLLRADLLVVMSLFRKKDRAAA